MYNVLVYMLKKNIATKALSALSQKKKKKALSAMTCWNIINNHYLMYCQVDFVCLNKTKFLQFAIL